MLSLGHTHTADRLRDTATKVVGNNKTPNTFVSRNLWCCRGSARRVLSLKTTSYFQTHSRSLV